MIPYPGFNPIAIEIGPFGNFGPLKVHWYGIMYLVAFAAGWLLGRVRAKRPGSTWKPADIDDFMFFGMLGTILGGRIGFSTACRSGPRTTPGIPSRCGTAACRSMAGC